MSQNTSEITRKDDERMEDDERRRRWVFSPFSKHQRVCLCFVYAYARSNQWRRTVVDISTFAAAIAIALSIGHLILWNGPIQVGNPPQASWCILTMARWTFGFPPMTTTARPFPIGESTMPSLPAPTRLPRIMPTSII